MSEQPVRWGVLGAARVFERRMVPGFRLASNAHLIAIASRSTDKAEQMAAKHAIPQTYGSYQALLDDPHIEAVYIPLPNDLHREWTLKALAAGKHVLCDKPGALSLDDARAMADAAKTSRLRLQEAFMYRHHPQHERIREIVASGAIGEPVRFHGVCAYVSNMDRTNIRFNTDQGGGALLDVGVYPLNAARWFFGEPDAVTGAARIDAESGIDLHTTALLEWNDGRTATIVGGFDQQFETRYSLIGTRGSVTAERAFQVGDVGVTITTLIGDEQQVETLPHLEQYAFEIEHFSACVRDPARPLSPGEDGVDQARIVEAIQRSIREKARVAIETGGPA